ncbi:flagellar assembly peptidoglycan hydrolase FlgJ [Methyloversatilis sp.]|uniref:flagellar assembly peptidoglycan hydrolase FlgJ n=1 Tax=Methyloversatilis sp. TaxID=2569862 RepID=UPI002732B54E|nr:flagellar assembly peptidoglycan hydrolase FlgJ [Methyloversatilis sp.]MDP3577782.1 flagellar assembly peptidoglycan hydrolase FlgJ [Methyloversatilis sp.]
MQSGTLNPMSQSLAADGASLNRLKFQAGQATPEAIKETAKQFEALFMRELLKSMRDATASMKSGMLDNPGSDLGSDLLDQQFAVQMAGQPGGLSEVIARQLMQQMSMKDQAKPDASTAPAAAAPTVPAPAAARDFVQQHGAAAQDVQRSSGLPASYLLGQAGHESGWGRREILMKDGSPSHNLFGIKAGAGWKGKVAEVTTTEYVDGQPQKTLARFRAYDSHAESFRDFAQLISNSPRYAQARQQTGSVQGWSEGLQDAGYATDPDYASKLSRAINTTLQVQRAQS